MGLRRDADIMFSIVLMLEMLYKDEPECFKKDLEKGHLPLRIVKIEGMIKDITGGLVPLNDQNHISIISVLKESITNYNKRKER